MIRGDIRVLHQLHEYLQGHRAKLSWVVGGGDRAKVTKWPKSIYWMVAVFAMSDSPSETVSIFHKPSDKLNVTGVSSSGNF